MNVPTKDFLLALRPLLVRLRADLKARAEAPAVNSALRAAHAAMQKDERTADAYEIWADERSGQIAAAWALSMVFVRTLEDRGLLERRRIAGEGAADSEDQMVTLAPHLTARDYLLTVFTELARLPGAKGVFGAINPVWTLAPSGAMARELIDFFRETDAQGELRFTFGGSDTRFLGDLYQDLDEDIRERYALLQTPDFVERFILEQTLDPAIAGFGLDGVSLIDPTCGSGHFLLGAFERLCNRWAEAEPSLSPTEVARRALERVTGADINPYAAAIARFRLTLAFLERAGYAKLADAPELDIRVVVADSLLAGVGQRDFAERASETSREGWAAERFLFEDPAETDRLLGRTYTAVVGNPPYITVKDKRLREKYREDHEACYREYQLVSPFVERFFKRAAPDGYVGAIVGNGFMKREFGKRLIETVLRRYELRRVVDSSGAFIPGHGTPTVLVFGRNQARTDAPVMAVLGKRGEPSTPDDPAQGLVWSSIRDHFDTVGFENDYVSVAEMPRERFDSHPWSLGGGGAAELKTLLEARAENRLGDIVSVIGFMCMTRADDIFFAPPGTFERFGIPKQNVILNVEGEKVRDWSIDQPNETLFPYDDELRPQPEVDGSRVHQFLWPYKEILWRRREPNGDHRELGMTWFEWSRFQRERFRTPLSIAFAFVATHNHFVLDRGGKVFKQSAPIIKLPEGATEDDHLALLAYLNSSTACFWMKQVFQPKHSAEHKTHPEPERNRYEHTGTGLGHIPTPEVIAQLAPLARALGELASERQTRIRDVTQRIQSATSAAELIDTLAERWVETDVLRERMLVLQEEIDWRVYELFGMAAGTAIPTTLLLDRFLCCPRGARPFEQLTARKSFVRARDHLVPLAEAEASPVQPLSGELEEVWSTRRLAIESSKELRLLEQPLFKRQWRDTDENIDEFTFRRKVDVSLLESFVSAAMESAFGSSEVALMSLRRVMEASGMTPGFSVVLETLGRLSDLATEAVMEAVAGSASVPFASKLTFAPTGLKKHALWLAVWDKQRRQDGGEDPNIDVPPKFKPEDYSSGAIYRNRGPLNVPKERFISYPGCESDDDPSPLYGWAGWDHLQRAMALATLYQRRKTEDGWGAERMTPMLAGLLELVPWLKQWHNEPNQEYGGQRLGDFYAGMVDEECRQLGLSLDDLRSWRPEKKTRGRAAKPKDGTPAPRRKRSTLDPAQLLAAVRALNGEAADLDTLAEALGAPKPTISKLVTELVEAGHLVEVSKRPRRVRLWEVEP